VFLARVIGDIVSTVEHDSLRGRKLLLIEKLDPERRPLGEKLIAVDSVDAGLDDTVLVVDEGGSAGLVVGLKDPPIRTVIVGVVDSIDLEV
jgi:microcompartment protein CcmK/EutM